jgi:hypothetical protein
VRQAASALYAAVPPADVVLVHTPGGKPVIAVPGQVPQLPVIIVLPVLVRVVDAIAPKELATPITTDDERFTGEGFAMKPAPSPKVPKRRAILQALKILHRMVM